MFFSMIFCQMEPLPLRFSPLIFCQKICLLECSDCILPRQFFFVCILPEDLYQNFSARSILPRTSARRYALLYFAQTGLPDSMPFRMPETYVTLFCQKYFASNKMPIFLYSGDAQRCKVIFVCILPKPLRFSPLYFASKCLLSLLYFAQHKRFCFGMYFAETFTLFSIVFCPKCNSFSIVFCPESRFFLYVFCRNLYAFSIAFCPKCNFWPLYFAQNAFFLYVFCRNPYSFLHCRLPQMPFFLP